MPKNKKSNKRLKVNLKLLKKLIPTLLLLLAIPVISYYSLENLNIVPRADNPPYDSDFILTFDNEPSVDDLAKIRDITKWDDFEYEKIDDTRYVFRSKEISKNEKEVIQDEIEQEIKAVKSVGIQIVNEDEEAKLIAEAVDNVVSGVNTKKEEGIDALQDNLKNKISDLKYVEPDYIVHGNTFNVPPNDTYFNRQWGLNYHTDADIDAPEGWNKNQGGPIKVAVIDTGVDYTHPDLGGCLGPNCKVIGGYDFVNSDSDPMDDHRHGTHVAGIIAATPDNNQGVAGVCANCSLLAYKVLRADNFGSTSNIMKAVDRAVSDGADIINMSLGGTSYHQSFQDIVNNAASKGVLVIAAAGNNNSDVKFYPAAYDNVLSVASTHFTNTRSDFSNYGSWVDIAAPGSSIFSTVPSLEGVSDVYTENGARYLYMSGTSMATPMVVGVAAIVKSIANFTPQQTTLHLQKTSIPNDDKSIGAGVVNLSSALNGLSTPTPTPTATPTPVTSTSKLTSPSNRSEIDTDVIFNWSINGSPSEHHIHIGTVSGGRNIFSKRISGTTTKYPNTSTEVNDFKSILEEQRGETIYLRLWTNARTVNDTRWIYEDYSFNIKEAAPTPTPTPIPTKKSELTSPAEDSVVSSETTFRWVVNGNPSEHHIYLGTNQGGYDILTRRLLGTDTLFPRSNSEKEDLATRFLNVNSNVVYMRLWTNIGTKTNSVWRYEDYSFRRKVDTKFPNGLISVRLDSVSSIPNTYAVLKLYYNKTDTKQAFTLNTTEQTVNFSVGQPLKSGDIVSLVFENDTRNTKGTIWTFDDSFDADRNINIYEVSIDGTIAYLYQTGTTSSDDIQEGFSIEYNRTNKENGDWYSNQDWGNIPEGFFDNKVETPKYPPKFMWWNGAFNITIE